MELNKTTLDKIKNSKRAYMLKLNERETRFAVYVESAEGLLPIWPVPWDSKSKNQFPTEKETHNYQLNQAKLLGMTYSKCRQLPAFHYYFNGCGYSKRQEIEECLRKYNPEISVYRLNGSYPDNSF